MYKYLLVTLFISTDCFCQTEIKDSSLLITKFTTKIQKLDSTWNTDKEIQIPTQPQLLTITYKDLKDTIFPNFICVFLEPMTIRDTLKLGRNSTLHFNNLAGGDYTLTFINLKNNNKREIKFSVAFVFWQRWWFVPVVFLITLSILGLIFYLFYLILGVTQSHK